MSNTQHRLWFIYIFCEYYNWLYRLHQAFQASWDLQEASISCLCTCSFLLRIYNITILNQKHVCDLFDNFRWLHSELAICYSYRKLPIYSGFPFYKIPKQKNASKIISFGVNFYFNWTNLSVTVTRHFSKSQLDYKKPNSNIQNLLKLFVKK